MVSPYIQFESDRIAKERAAMNAQFDVTTFKFYRETPKEIIATNGPVVLVFEITSDTTLRFVQEGSHTRSNYTKDYEFLPQVALAAARWRRRNAPRSAVTE